ncbi:MAG: methyltransferase domain-containing protein [Anaerolineales bacterium]|nr:methyltransferase domain-containing protein [Anaerolineales bacterium]
MDSELYFDSADRGLGTTYERWALNRFLLRITADMQIESVLEGPDDGIAGIDGINSLNLARKGAKATVLLRGAERAAFSRAIWERYAPDAEVQFMTEFNGACLPFPDNSFDLVWNFNVMPREADPFQVLAEMGRVARKAVLICVPNRHNYSFWMHRLHHRVAHDLWDHGRIDLMQARSWEKYFERLGFKDIQNDHVDCPWWPDIIDISQLIVDFFPFMRSAADKVKPESRYLWPADGLPYYDRAEFAEVHADMDRLAYFENTRIRFIKRLFAHHTAVWARKA